MKVDLNMKFKEIDGKDYKELIVVEDEEGVRKVDPAGNFFMKPGETMTLKKACINVLTNPPLSRDDRGNPQELSGETKLRYSDLAMRLFKASGLYELSSKEIVLLTRLIHKTYRSPLVYTQAFEALDPHAAKEELDKIAEARKKDKEAEKALQN